MDKFESRQITQKSCDGATVGVPDACFFCNESSGELHKVLAFNVDSKIKKCALNYKIQFCQLS